MKRGKGPLSSSESPKQIARTPSPAEYAVPSAVVVRISFVYPSPYPETPFGPLEEE